MLFRGWVRKSGVWCSDCEKGEVRRETIHLWLDSPQGGSSKGFKVPFSASSVLAVLVQSRYVDTKTHQISQDASVCLRPKRGEQAWRRAAIYRYWSIHHTCPDLSVTPAEQPMRRRHPLKKGPHDTHLYYYCCEDFHRHNALPSPSS